MSKDFDVQSIRVFAASCCVVSGVFWDCPASCGYGINYELCCITYDCCCKCGGQGAYACNAPEGSICRLGLCCCAVGCKKPNACCRVSYQACCCMTLGAIPCDETVPCACGYLGLTCYPIFGCCVRLADIPNEKRKIIPS